MKRIIFMLLILLMGTTLMFAEHFRMGITGAVELLNRPNYENFLKEFDNWANIIPGFYWEVIPDEHLGFGMTYLVKFDKLHSAIPDLHDEWYLDWIASWDFRYHFLKRFIIDPFLEAGFGSAGRVDVTNYEKHGCPAGNRDPLMLSLFAQVGGGAALRLGRFHAGAKLMYRFLNTEPPATQLDPYPLKNFNFALSGGFSF